MEIASGIYRHLIGNSGGRRGCTYNVIGITENTESNAQFVLMQVWNKLNQGEFWHMPLALYFAEIEKSNLYLIGRSSPKPAVFDDPKRIDMAQPGRYRHFKGNFYNGIGPSFEVVGLDEVAGSPTTRDGLAGMIAMMYQPLYGTHAYKLCHRSLAMFNEHVEKPEQDYSGPRFRLVERYTKAVIAKP